MKLNELLSEALKSFISKYQNGNLYLTDTKLSSLKDIHKNVKKLDGNGKIFATRNPIKSHVLGVLLIQGCRELILDNKEVQDIVNKYLPNNEGMNAVLRCQEELFEADLDDFAQL